MSKSPPKAPRINWPHYDYDVLARIATLLEPVTYRQTGVYGYTAAIEHATLAEDGNLYLRTGFRWDFGSGPAIDTPGMVYASLAHDALYDMINADQLPASCRKAADKYLVKCLKDAGVAWWRRSYVYLAVRYGYPITTLFGASA